MANSSHLNCLTMYEQQVEFESTSNVVVVFAMWQNVKLQPPLPPPSHQDTVRAYWNKPPISWSLYGRSQWTVLVTVLIVQWICSSYDTEFIEINVSILSEGNVSKVAFLWDLSFLSSINCFATCYRGFRTRLTISVRRKGRSSPKCIMEINVISPRCCCVNF